MKFGFKKGRNRLSFKKIIDLKEYFKELTTSPVGIFFLIGAGLAFLLTMGLQLVSIPSRTISIVFILGMGLWFSYPFYLIREITGDERIWSVIKYYIFMGVISFIGSIILFTSPVALLVPIASSVLALGLVYPNKITLLDAVILYFVLAVIGSLLFMVTGTALAGSILLSEPAKETVMSLV